jgi:hypothetical protein
LHENLQRDEIKPTLTIVILTNHLAVAPFLFLGVFPEMSKNCSETVLKFFQVQKTMTAPLLTKRARLELIKPKAGSDNKISARSKS